MWLVCPVYLVCKIETPPEVTVSKVFMINNKILIKIQQRFINQISGGRGGGQTYLNTNPQRLLETTHPHRLLESTHPHRLLETTISPAQGTGDHSNPMTSGDNSTHLSSKVSHPAIFNHSGTILAKCYSEVLYQQQRHYFNTV